MNVVPCFPALNTIRHGSGFPPPGSPDTLMVMPLRTRRRTTLRRAALCASVLLGAATHATADESAPADTGAATEAIEVTTSTPLTTRDAPGVVTVVEREEIERSGARDLLDVLQLVPGFTMALDTQGVVSTGFRGVWGQEGKVLFLLDGQELNETLYSTMQLGLHIAAGIIERVEVIRGPGSVVHGGFAELAVVNIVTRDARTLDGAAASLTYGQLGSGFGHVAATASHAARYERIPGLSTSLHLAWGEGKRSDGAYTDLSGRTVALGGDSRLGDLLVDLGVGYRGLRLRLIYDDYRVDSRDGLGEVLPVTARSRFESIYLELRYQARLHRMVTLTPHLSWKQQTPYQVTDHESPLFYDKTARRLRAGLQLAITPHASTDLLVGVAGLWDHGQLNDPTIDHLQTRFGDAMSVNYGTVAGYAQVLQRNVIANLAAGARYEWHSRFGSSFVPRLGLTRIAGRFNFKLLYSRAFRAPGIENLNLASGDIRPEITDVVEAEVGVQLSGHLALSINGYWMRIEDTIVYSVTAAGEGYANAGRTGSAGAESQLRMKYAWGFANLGYSFSHPAAQNTVASFTVPGDSTRLLGLPSHKVTLSSGWNVWADHLSFGVTAVVMSPRKGFGAGDGMGNPVLGEEPWLALIGLSASWRNLGARGLDLTVGVNNALSEQYRVLQPYAGGHAALPMAGRELLLRLAYSAPIAE